MGHPQLLWATCSSISPPLAWGGAAGTLPGPSLEVAVTA